LFEHPYTDETRAEKTILCPEHLEVAKEAASESFVLLQNNHQFLPLSSNMKSVAVIGPLADGLTIRWEPGYSTVKKKTP
jgi:beta-glucosidase